MTGRTETLRRFRLFFLLKIAGTELFQSNGSIQLFYAFICSTFAVLKLRKRMSEACLASLLPHLRGRCVANK